MTDAPTLPATLSLEQITVREEFNPRDTMEGKQLDQLARSIRERGLLQPVIVRPFGEGYVLIDGARRLAAIELAAKGAADQAHAEQLLGAIPITIRSNEDEADDLVDAVTANQIRVDLNPVEEAKAYRRLKDTGRSERQIAAELAVSQKLVKERLALLELPNEVLDLVAEGAVPLGTIALLASAAKASPALSHAIALTAAEFDRTATQLQDAPLWNVQPEDDSKGFGVFPRGQMPKWFVYSADTLALIEERKKLTSGYGGAPSVHGSVIEEGLKLGTVWRWEDKSQDVAVVDLAWYDEAAGRAIKRQLTKLRKEAKDRATRAAAAGIGVPRGYAEGEDGSVHELSDEEKKAQNAQRRQELRDERDRAYGANAQLATGVLTKTKTREIDRDLALHLAKLVLRHETGHAGRAGLGLALSQYVTEPDKPTQVRKFDLDAAAHDAWGFIEAGQTPQEVIQRLAMLIAIASTSATEAVAESNRPRRPDVAQGEGAEFARWYCQDGLPSSLRVRKLPPVVNPVREPAKAAGPGEGSEEPKS